MFSYIEETEEGTIFYQVRPWCWCFCWAAYYPKISDFGAVDDEGKRSISLWHKQTPGIPGVDFHLERLYNILQS